MREKIPVPMKERHPGIEELKNWLQEKKEYEFFQLPGYHHERILKKHLKTIDEYLGKKHRKKKIAPGLTDFEYQYFRTICDDNKRTKTKAFPAPYLIHKRKHAG